jgi:hypothetical protein
MEKSGERERTALKQIREELKGMKAQVELKERLERISSLIDVVQV